jgi:hypothetical protein
MSCLANRTVQDRTSTRTVRIIILIFDHKSKTLIHLLSYSHITAFCFRALALDSSERTKTSSKIDLRLGYVQMTWHFYVTLKRDSKSCAKIFSSTLWSPTKMFTGRGLNNNWFISQIFLFIIFLYVWSFCSEVHVRYRVWPSSFLCTQKESTL